MLCKVQFGGEWFDAKIKDKEHPNVCTVLYSKKAREADIVSLTMTFTENRIQRCEPVEKKEISTTAFVNNYKNSNSNMYKTNTTIIQRDDASGESNSSECIFNEYLYKPDVTEEKKEDSVDISAYLDEWSFYKRTRTAGQEEEKLSSKQYDNKIIKPLREFQHAEDLGTQKIDERFPVPELETSVVNDDALFTYDVLYETICEYLADLGGDELVNIVFEFVGLPSIINREMRYTGINLFNGIKSIRLNSDGTGVWRSKFNQLQKREMVWMLTICTESETSEILESSHIRHLFDGSETRVMNNHYWAVVFKIKNEIFHCFLQRDRDAFGNEQNLAINPFKKNKWMDKIWNILFFQKMSDAGMVDLSKY